jgi:alkylation response protein AidB-like acyl-CoA dehydrogenase
MDVRFSPEQEALRDSVAKVAERLGPQAVGQLDDAERAGKLDAAVAASGWRELRIGDEHGAPLASGVEVAIVAEELGRRVVDAPFLGPTLAAELRRLARVAPAERDETFVLAAGLGALATAMDDALAVDAASASAGLLAFPGTHGAVLASVPLGRPERKVDLTRATAAVEADPTQVSGRPLTADDLRRWTALGLAVTCADLVGTMGGATHLACEYAGARHQYGVAVGSFQAVQHLLADAHVATEGSRSVTLHAAWAVDALEPDEALAAAAVAKAYCARAARTVCETAIQVHGGIGNTWECLAHVYLRRALLSIDILGGTGPSLARVLDHYGIANGKRKDGGDGLR